ncbi:MAG: tRNA pseudouridine(38-40) synthase TruA [bacterium]
MYNYKLVIEYDGKNFNGWQRQKNNSNTIQEKIEAACTKFFKYDIKIFGAGRTDAGVSAYNQVANFKAEEKVDLYRFRYSLNSLLPQSISIKKISFVPDKFHSRYSAKKREYIYKVCNEKRSIEGDFFYKINFDIDFKKTEKFIKLILEQKTFRSFCKKKEDKHNFYCKIYKFSFKAVKSKDEIIFRITANRFLHSMVRAIIGCALETGRGKITITDIKKQIKRGEKIDTYYLPAKALFLNKIYY